MGKGGKKKSSIWQAAENVRQLDNHVFKRLIANYQKDSENNLLVRGDFKLNMTVLKRAYNNRTKTRTHHRALLLHSLFEPTDWLTNQYNRGRDVLDRSSKIGLQVVYKKGEYYFKLVNQEYRSIRMNNLMMEGLQARRLRAPTSVNYVKALTTSGIKNQKIAGWCNEFNTCIFAIAEVIVTTIKITDPLNKFGSPPDDGDYELDRDDRPESGSMDDKKQVLLEEYKRRLMYAKDQFEGYAAISNKLGIDVGHIRLLMDELITKVTAYNNLTHHLDDVLDDCHLTGIRLVESLHEFAHQIEDIDVDDIRIREVAMNTTVPVFRDLKVRTKFHRSAEYKGASKAIKEYATDMLKGVNWTFDD